MSFVPSEVRLDHKFLEWDREWIFQRLPKNDIQIPRECEPEIEADAIPTIAKQPADPNTTWTETGIDQIQMGPSVNGQRN